MAIWTEYRVSDVVSNIDDGKFVLPVIQRELVWNEDKMCLLFDTLLKGNSFGGIIVLEEEKDSKPLFAFRKFSPDGTQQNSYEENKLSQNQFFVIDGQQRLQSFYIGLKGSIHGKRLFFDLFSDYKSDYDFRFAKNESELPQESKDNREIKEHYWISAEVLFKLLKECGKTTIISNKLINDKGISEENKKEVLKNNMQIFSDYIINFPAIGIAKVTVDKFSFSELENRQKIVELFKRLNDGGTPLSAMDLVASTLKAFDPHMEGFLRNLTSEYTNIGLSSENLIKLIFLLEDNYTKEIFSIEPTDADFAVKNQIRIKCTLESLKKFLEENRLYEYYDNGNRSFIPLFFVAYHIFHKKALSDEQLVHFWDNSDTSNNDVKPIKEWLYHSLLNGLFKSRGAGWIPYKTGIRKILEIMKKHKNGAFPTSELFDMYKSHGLSFKTNYTPADLDTLDAQFLFYLMYDMRRPVKKVDIDHIMSKNILEKKEYDYEDINSIRNFQLLDFGTNRGDKNGKPFAEWVNNSEFVVDKKSYIQRHLIPRNEEIWTEDKFYEFTQARAELIVDKIKSYF